MKFISKQRTRRTAAGRQRGSPPGMDETTEHSDEQTQIQPEQSNIIAGWWAAKRSLNVKETKAIQKYLSKVDAWWNEQGNWNLQEQVAQNQQCRGWTDAEHREAVQENYYGSGRCLNGAVNRIPCGRIKSSGAAPQTYNAIQAYLAAARHRVPTKGEAKLR